MLEREVYDTITYCADGKCAIVWVTLDMLKSLNIGEDEIEGLASIPRQIEGVLIGITMKEKRGRIFSKFPFVPTAILTPQSSAQSLAAADIRLRQDVQ